MVLRKEARERVAAHCGVSSRTHYTARSALDPVKLEILDVDGYNGEYLKAQMVLCTV